jgi:hypothetical protein
VQIRKRFGYVRPQGVSIPCTLKGFSCPLILAQTHPSSILVPNRSRLPLLQADPAAVPEPHGARDFESEAVVREHAVRPLAGLLRRLHAHLPLPDPQRPLPPPREQGGQDVARWVQWATPRCDARPMLSHSIALGWYRPRMVVFMSRKTRHEKSSLEPDRLKLCVVTSLVLAAWLIRRGAWDAVPKGTICIVVPGVPKPIATIFHTHQDTLADLRKLVMKVRNLQQIRVRRHRVQILNRYVLRPQSLKNIFNGGFTFLQEDLTPLPTEMERKIYLASLRGQIFVRPQVGVVPCPPSTQFRNSRGLAILEKGFFSPGYVI